MNEIYEIYLRALYLYLAFVFTFYDKTDKTTVYIKDYSQSEIQRKLTGINKKKKKKSKLNVYGYKLHTHVT